MGHEMLHPVVCHQTLDAGLYTLVGGAPLKMMAADFKIRISACCIMICAGLPRAIV